MGAFKRQDLMDRHYRQQWEEAERMEMEYFESLYLNSLPVVKADPGDEQPEHKTQQPKGTKTTNNANCTEVR